MKSQGKIVIGKLYQLSTKMGYFVNPAEEGL